MKNDSTDRNIQTDYYRGSFLVKSNLALHANKAVEYAVRYMRSNKYEATHAEVYDRKTAKQHSALRNALIKGKLTMIVVFEGDYKPD